MNAGTQLTKGRLVAKLNTSSLFKSYSEGFQKATGLPLVLQIADKRFLKPDVGSESTNRFCRMLNGGRTPCEQCGMASRCIGSQANEQAHTMQCFAGLRETAIPVRCGRETFAYLRTGQVFMARPSEGRFEKVASALKEAGHCSSEIGKLRKAYLDSRVIDPRTYNGMIMMLGAFALQLSENALNIVLSSQSRSHPMVGRARRYIARHLAEPLSLDQVSAKVGVSPFYFCKLFKRETGQTFSEYVNRQRVEWAKQKLQKPDTSVTEIAYDVGYQSLSQFNRSFRRFVGNSPSGYRACLFGKKDERSIGRRARLTA